MMHWWRVLWRKFFMIRNLKGCLLFHVFHVKVEIHPIKYESKEKTSGNGERENIWERRKRKHMGTES